LTDTIINSMTARKVRAIYWCGQIWISRPESWNTSQIDDKKGGEGSNPSAGSKFARAWIAGRRAGGSIPLSRPNDYLIHNFGHDLSRLA